MGCEVMTEPEALLGAFLDHPERLLRLSTKYPELEKLLSGNSLLSQETTEVLCPGASWLWWR